MLEHEIHKLYSSFQPLKSPFFFLSNSYIVYIPWWLSGKESTCNTGDVSWIPGSGRPPPGEGNGNSLQCSCLGNPMDRGAWQATVHGVTKSQT